MGDADTTGRFAIAFAADAWEHIHEALRRSDVLREGELAMERHTVDPHPAPSRVPHLVMPRMGFAAITPKSDAVTTAQLQAIAGVSGVRREHVMRRPRTPSEPPVADGGLWLDGDQLSWALHAL